MPEILKERGISIMMSYKREHTTMPNTDFYQFQRDHRGTVPHPRQGGFTLIELSIVLVIVGFFMVGLIKAYELYQIDKIESEQDSKMDIMRRALSSYIQDEKCIDSNGNEKPETWCRDNGREHLANESIGGEDAVRYPCPADPDLAPDKSGYATEARSGGSCETDNLVEITDSGSTVAFKGAFPARTVGLSPEKMVDPYGNKYSYVVSKDMTQTDALNKTSSEGNLEISTESGDTHKARFGLFSHGQNGEGAYTRAGHQIGVNNTNSTDAENADTDNDFAMRQGQFRAEGDTYYDDSFAASLVDEKDDEWWHTMDDAGQDLTHRNPGNLILSQKAGSRVGIGTNSPSSKLNIADGSVHMNNGKIFLRDEEGIEDPSITPFHSGSNINILGAKDGDTADRTSGYRVISHGGWSMFNAVSITDGSLGQAPIFRGTRGRGSLNAPQPPDKGDGLAVFEGAGAFATGDHPMKDAAMGAGMAIIASENHNASQNGSEIIFRTVPNNQEMAKESMKIKNNGNICGTDAHLSNCSSDERLKTDIQDYTVELDKLTQLEPVRFKWNEKGQELYNYGNDRHLTGFLAQDVKKVLPQWVSKDDKGYYTLNSGQLRYALLSGMKQLRAEKDKQIRKLRAEKNQQISQLQSEIKKIKAHTGMNNKQAAFGSGGASTALWALVLLLVAGLGVQNWRHKRAA